MQPNQLIDKLSAIRTRAKMLAVTMGGGFVVTALLAALVGVVLLDYLLNLPGGARLMLMLAGLAVVVVVLVRDVIKPAAEKITVSDVAGRVEATFPQFDDRLRSTVNFLNEGIPGSDAMKERVAVETARLAGTVDFNRVIVTRPLWRSLGIAGGALVLVLLIGLLMGDQYRGIAMTRLFAPFADTPWPKSVQIAMQNQPPVRVTAGQRFYLNMKLAKGDKASRKAKLFYQYPGQKPVEELMTRGEDGVYTGFHDAKLADNAASGQVKLWIQAGDDEIQPFEVQIVPKLAITRVEALVTPPSYANLPTVTINLRESPAVMAAGAQVVMKVGFNKPLSSKAILLESTKPEQKLPAIAIDRDGDRTAVIRFSPRESAELRVKATDTDDFTNESNESYQFTIRPDQNPTVLIENPRGNEQRTAVATVPLVAVAEDDYGIKTVTLNVERLGDHRKWSIPLVASSSPLQMVGWSEIDGSGDLQRHRLNYTWDLGQLEKVTLESGDVLEYHLSVTDNFALDGQTHPPVNSGKLRITIISQEQLTEQIVAETRNAARQVGEIKKTQNSAKAETQNLIKDTEKHDNLDDAAKNAAEQIANKQSTAASQTKQVAKKMDGLVQRMEENKSTANDLKEMIKQVGGQLNRTAEGPQKDATDKINQAKDNPTPKEQRNENLNQAVEKQQDAANRLDQAMNQLGKSGTLPETIDKIRDILREQEAISKETQRIGRENLGKRPQDMKPEDRKALEKNAADQKNLADRTAKALEEMKESAQQLAKSDPSTSQAMQDAARTGEQQQVPQSQQKASSAASKNQQSQAQASQKQAELGLQMMLSALKEAERRKLEELSEQLAKLKEQIENQIRRQAAHNLDNLTIQGPERVAKIDPKVIDDLFLRSQRGRDREVRPPTVQQLSAAQELTERNTRDLARTAEDMPQGGAEIAAHLTRASGKMQAAIVWLRQSKLNDAYDPPQVEALYSLLQAMNQLEEVEKKVNEELDKQKKDSIKAALQKIREDQDKLNKTTIKIDQSPRNADGSYKREQAATLNGLPGEQGKLTFRTQAVGVDLEGMGGVVYVWAVKDISETMTAVKDQLAKPETGQVVQIDQARIIEQLDAMIDSLKTNPKKDFEAKGGGGSGGGGAPPLPTEAELRLLKAMQVAVNTATSRLAAQPDKERILATGNRQGSLRDLLGELVRKSARMDIGPEPDVRNLLPENATEQDLENQELQEELAAGKPLPEKGGQILRAASRMARSRQRLAINADPGRVTQMIQKKIILDLDELIEQARQQQASGSPPPGQKKPGEQMGQPQPGQAGKPQNQGGQKPGQASQGGAEPAQDSHAGAGGSEQADLTKDIREKMAEWGAVTQRERDAILEAQGEEPIGKYRKYLDDYYKAQAIRAAERQ